MKIILIVIDGLGDEPIPELGNKTPLEAAKTPHLDWLASHGICGLARPIFETAIPTSEGSHLSLFGYKPNIGRGLIEARALKVELKPRDIALRGNFATVDEKLNILDRRAGRIADTKPFIKSLSGKIIDGIEFLIYPIAEHRIVLILRGKNLSDKITNGDPYYEKLENKAEKIVSLDKSLKAKFTAEVLNKFLFAAQQILKDHPLNKDREKNNQPLVNYILTRGAGSPQKIPSFKEKYGLNACGIAGKNLYQGIARLLGMKLIKVKGANGLPTTNLKGKFLAIKKASEKYNFVFCHIKAADSLAEDGNFLGKKEFIEKIDDNLEPILKIKNTLIVVTADHSTCSKLKRHCDKPCPVLIYSSLLHKSVTLSTNKPKKFSEKNCLKGTLGLFPQQQLMLKILERARR